MQSNLGLFFSTFNSILFFLWGSVCVCVGGKGGEVVLCSY